MSIIKATCKHYSQEEPNSLVSLKQASSVLSHDNEFIDEVLKCFSIKNDEQSMKESLLIGNVKQLLADISELDNQTEKIDVIVNLKNIYHFLFHIYDIHEEALIKKLKADNLIVESQYSARTDILEYYDFSKVSELPKMIDKYIEQVSKDARAIKSIKNPQEVKEYIKQKIQNARKEDFIGYKPEIIKKLASMETNSVFELFELLRNVDELFGDDIKSKDFWRQKLYDALINRGKYDK